MTKIYILRVFFKKIYLRFQRADWRKFTAPNQFSVGPWQVSYDYWLSIFLLQVCFHSNIFFNSFYQLYTCTTVTPVLLVHLYYWYTYTTVTPVLLLHLYYWYTCTTGTPVLLVHLYCSPVLLVHLYY